MDPIRGGDQITGRREESVDSRPVDVLTVSRTAHRHRTKSGDNKARPQFVALPIRHAEAGHGCTQPRLQRAKPSKAGDESTARSVWALLVVASVVALGLAGLRLGSSADPPPVARVGATTPDPGPSGLAVAGEPVAEIGGPLSTPVVSDEEAQQSVESEVAVESGGAPAVTDPVIPAAPPVVPTARSEAMTTPSTPTQATVNEAFAAPVPAAARISPAPAPAEALVIAPAAAPADVAVAEPAPAATPSTRVRATNASTEAASQPAPATTGIAVQREATSPEASAAQDDAPQQTNLLLLGGGGSPPSPVPSGAGNTNPVSIAEDCPPVDDTVA